jgi:hypothetical protein
MTNYHLARDWVLNPIGSHHAHNKSLSFKDTTIYSYRAPIARRMGNIVLINDDYARYSTTTSNHISLVVSTAYSYPDIKIIWISFKDPNSLSLFWTTIEKHISSYSRARSSQVKATIRRWIIDQWDMAHEYAELIKLDKRSATYRYRTQIVKLLLKHQILGSA